MVGSEKLVALAAALVLCSGCMGRVEEVPLAPADVLPVGSDERRIPQAIFDALGFKFTASNQAWARGFHWSGNWEQTVAHVETAALAAGYTKLELPPIKSVNAAGITNEQYIRDYVSPGETIELVLINLDILHQRGGYLDTSAKYLLFSGNSAELQRAMQPQPSANER
jgi:hypothetical protein